ncbi:MAG: FAD-dependent oxidoreductase [Acidobacteria bacterium]|nr:FAD-dependent oxidoreductase [Acidobacteriota bacterium]
MRPTFVIVGANLAGASAAITLRDEGFDGQIVLIGAEPDLPYERPPLSKAYLRGEVPFEKTLVRPADFYREHNIDLRLGVRVSKVDVVVRRLECTGDERVPYDALLIATGGRNRRLPIPGFDLDGVYDLRTRHHADRIRAEMAPGRRAVIVGMGFIGSEVAASLRTAGVDVVAIEPAKTPLLRVLGEEIGGVVGRLHRDHGVRAIFGDTVVRFEGAGRVERVLTKSGTQIDCDFAVVGLGIEPATEVVAGTAVRVDNGILVDELCRTNVDGVFAAGDVANHFHPVFGRHLRVEHWQNALKQGAAAARSMMGKGQPYDEIHWFWSDQYDANLQYAGFHTKWDQLILRGSLDRRDFVAFYLNGPRIDAAVALNRPKDIRLVIPLIKRRVVVDLENLRDPNVDLRKLATA